MIDRIDMVFEIVQRLECKVDRLSESLTHQRIRVAVMAATVSALVSAAAWAAKLLG